MGGANMSKSRKKAKKKRNSVVKRVPWYRREVKNLWGNFVTALMILVTALVIVVWLMYLWDMMKVLFLS
jgi:uncharacterized membrane protein